MSETYQQEKRRRFEKLVGGVRSKKRWTTEEIATYFDMYFDLKSPETIARVIHRSVLAMESKRQKYPEEAVKLGLYFGRALRGHRFYNHREDDFISNYCKRCIKKQTVVDARLLSWCLNRSVDSVEKRIEEFQTKLGFQIQELL